MYVYVNVEYRVESVCMDNKFCESRAFGTTCERCQ